MLTPIGMGMTIAAVILLIGARGLYLKRLDDQDAAEDKEAMAEWEMHSAIAMSEENDCH